MVSVWVSNTWANFLILTNCVFFSQAYAEKEKSSGSGGTSLEMEVSLNFFRA